MGDLHPARRQCECEIDHFADPIDIGTMHYCIHGQRQFEPDDLPRQRLLSCESTAVAGNVVSGRGDAVLKRNLHMVEPLLGKRAKPLGSHPDCGRDEVAIQACIMGSGCDLDQIGTGGRLTSGQMDL
jgi:hypothetical protein